MVSCPVCDSAIEFEEDDLDEGDELTCEECGAELRVTGVHPLEMEVVEEDEEDLEPDEDEEEDWR